MTPDIISVLEIKLNGLSPTERAIAQAILDSPDEASELSIGQLAERAGSSETSVTRFCRSIGLTGYAQLRMRLAVAVESRRSRSDGAPESAALGDFAPDDALSEIVKKVAFAGAQAVEFTAQQLDLDVLAEVVSLLSAARRVLVFGVGSGAAVAVDASAKLTLAGCAALGTSDVHAGLMATALYGPDDVVLGFTHSGRAKEVIEILTEGRARGASTVVVTSDPTSPAARSAAHVLQTGSREMGFRSGGLASRIAALTVLDCVFVALTHRHYGASLEAMEAMRDAVRHHVARTDRGDV